MKLRPLWIAALLMLTFASYAEQYASAERPLPPVINDDKVSLDFCSDNEDWYPFTFFVEREFTGQHVDIVTEAAKRINVNVRFHPMPWTRCLQQIKAGIFDGVVTIAYQAPRESFLIYPEDSNVVGLAPFRVSALRNIFITMADYPTDYDGTVASISQPVRVPRGWSIVADLEARGIEVSQSAVSIDANIKALLRDKNGSVIMNYELYRQLIGSGQWSPLLRAHQKVFNVKNYFLAFTRSSDSDQKLREQLWQSIRDVRNDGDFMQRMLEQYQTKPK